MIVSIEEDIKKSKAKVNKTVEKEKLKQEIATH